MPRVGNTPGKWNTNVRHQMLKNALARDRELRLYTAGARQYVNYGSPAGQMFLNHIIRRIKKNTRNNGRVLPYNRKVAWQKIRTAFDALNRESPLNANRSEQAMYGSVFRLYDGLR